MDVPVVVWGEAVSDEALAAWHHTGAIRFRGFANAAEVDVLRSDLDALSDRWVAERCAKVNGIPIKYGRRPDGVRYVQRFAFTSLFAPAFAAFLGGGRMDPILDLAGPGWRVGVREKDGVVVNHYRNEPGSRYRRLGWHTDGLRDLAYGRLPGPMLNVGVYLDDSPEEKGALRILPGSHKQGFWSMCFRKPYFVDHRTDPSEVVVSAAAGDLTIHDGRLWHRVGLARCSGEQSVRRTMYVPFLRGPEQIKDARSPTPFYHRLQWVTG
jgi:hypothetical protein